MSFFCDYSFCLCDSFVLFMFFLFKQKTAYEMRISDWSSDVCSSDLAPARDRPPPRLRHCSSHHIRSRPSCVGRRRRSDKRPRPGAHRRRGRPPRSEERRVGNECVSKCSSRWSTQHTTKKDRSAQFTIKISSIHIQINTINK